MDERRNSTATKVVDTMIPETLIVRIANSQLSGLRVAELLSDLALAINKAQMPGGTLTLDFVAPSDVFMHGDLIPSISLTLKRVHVHVATDENPPQDPANPPAPESVVE